MNKKSLIILIAILGIIVISLLFVLVTRKPKVVVKVETKENIEKIDSLNTIIEEYSNRVDSLTQVKEKVREKVIVRVEELKIMPPDSTLYVFHEYTEKYGELNSNTPKLTEDSIVLCSVDNIRDANIISAKLEGEIQKTEALEQIVSLDSSIINSKDSIITQKDIILDKTVEAYQSSLDDLAKSVKKEKRKKKTVFVVGAAVAAALAGLLIVK